MPDDVTSDEVVFPGFREMVGRLADRRRALGMSQTQVAARMGTSQSAVARLEAGRDDVRLSTVARYAAALDQRVGFAVDDPKEAGR